MADSGAVRIGERTFNEDSFSGLNYLQGWPDLLLSFPEMRRDAYSFYVNLAQDQTYFHFGRFKAVLPVGLAHLKPGVLLQFNRTETVAGVVSIDAAAYVARLESYNKETGAAVLLGDGFIGNYRPASKALRSHRYLVRYATNLVATSAYGDYRNLGSEEVAEYLSARNTLGVRNEATLYDYFEDFTSGSQPSGLVVDFASDGLFAHMKADLSTGIVAGSRGRLTMIGPVSGLETHVVHGWTAPIFPLSTTVGYTMEVEAAVEFLTIGAGPGGSPTAGIDFVFGIGSTSVTPATSILPFLTENLAAIAYRWWGGSPASNSAFRKHVRVAGADTDTNLLSGTSVSVNSRHQLRIVAVRGASNYSITFHVNGVQIGSAVTAAWDTNVFTNEGAMTPFFSLNTPVGLIQSVVNIDYLRVKKTLYR